MDSHLKIHTQQLRDGKRQEIEHVLPPDFLQVEEQDLVFKSPIYLKGEAYVTDDHLILQLSAQTEVMMHCNLCNEMIFIPLQTEEIYHTIPLSELDSTIFDFSDLVREEIILLIPQFVECQGGRCPQRNLLSKLMKTKANSTPHHTPFSDFL